MVPYLDIKININFEKLDSNRGWYYWTDQTAGLYNGMGTRLSRSPQN